MDINAGTSSSLLHVYILAVDQPYSRPRLLSHVVKKWRTLLEGLGQEGSAFVMLYHQDLVDAARFSTQRASGLPGDVHGAKEPDQRKADAAVAALEPYFEELKALHFAPHQMCAYLPNEAPIRIVERLRAVFAERTARLTAAFDSYSSVSYALHTPAAATVIIATALRQGRRMCGTCMSGGEEGTNWRYTFCILVL
ncbi:hypothetical protein C3747_69g221 [Trypanosoma cruzi]|uniref:Uncharacterized protein n=1 Tax=Trypanosoma cruzi TaxID=5693 RepID=A0A2V2WPJ4_TRYCR|nr:hypothetical protein C3747_69g221 [Trypanosoma cruzi]